VHVQCVPGKFFNVTGPALTDIMTIATIFKNVSSVCFNCTQGSYALVGAAVCTLCQAGKFSTAYGIEASDESVCLKCAAGTSSGAGASACSDCLAGTYSLPVIVKPMTLPEIEKQQYQTEFLA